MKQLMAYVSPNKTLDKRTEQLFKMQIDNSLEMGWDVKDIVLAANFKYKYRGVESLDIKYAGIRGINPRNNKALVISYLLNNGMLGDDLYWCHDFDAFQMYDMSGLEFEMEGFDLGLTSYAYKDEWQCGNVFFKKEAKDIFNLWKLAMVYIPRNNRCEEKVLKKLTDWGAIGENRYKSLNNTYNFGCKFVKTCYALAIKPIRVVHFNPWEVDPTACDPQVLNIMMYGNNRLKKVLMTDRLIKIFKEYKIL